MVNAQNVVLSDAEIEKCLAFSKRSAETQQAIEFGQKTTSARKVEEIARDNMIGKMAEVAFAKIMFENYGIRVKLDFECYPRGQWDSADAVINGWRIDIKGTRRGGHWMLIEWNKLDFRQRYNNLSHVYAMFTVDWDRDTDRPTGRVRFEGVASLEKLRAGCKTTEILRKGDAIPGTSACLQADNFGIRFEHLCKDLNIFVSRVTKEEPPERVTKCFQNPYTIDMIQTRAC